MAGTDASQVEIKIGSDLVGPIIEKKIQAAIISALGEPEQLVGQLVSSVLRRKVNSDGVESTRYDSENKYDLVDVICRKAITKAVKEAMMEWVEANTPALKEALKQQIAKRPAGFAKMFLDGLAKTMKSQWRFSVTVGDQRD